MKGIQVISYVEKSLKYTDCIVYKESLEIPSVNGNQVIIKVIASSINPIDYKYAGGFLHYLGGRHPPYTPLFDFAGTVEAVGKNCRRIKQGEKVWGMTHYSLVGCSAEYVIVLEANVALKPDNISFKDAAVLPMISLTAHQCLHSIGGIKEGEKVLVLGGSGGVGHAAAQIAKASKCHVATTASDETFIKSLGVVDHFINYKEKDWSVELKNEQYDVIFDTVGEIDSWDKAISQGVLKNSSAGRFVSITNQGGFLHLTGAMLGRGFKSLFGSPRFTQLVAPDTSFPFMDLIASLVKDGKLKGIIEREFKLEEVPLAIEQQSLGRCKGKLSIIIIPSIANEM